jgi:hypothetical protein
MRAELRALVGIEPALEQVSHDTRLDELPVGFAGFGEFADFFFGQLEHTCLLEKVTIEMFDLVRPERSALGHAPK